VPAFAAGRDTGRRDRVLLALEPSIMGAQQPQRGFQTPPEITRYFEQKSLKPAFSWQDVWAEEHAYAFTVAKAVDAELLGLFKSSIQRAIENGQGFETWRRELGPELQRLGWYGPRKVDDPTGKWKSKIVDFSRPARLQTIFWSNVRAARAAGQWERIQRTKKGLPYLLYVRTTSAEPRPQHLAWAGIILPVDHDFWKTHFPPNGWGCKCAVRQITRMEYERLAATGDYLLEPPTIETRPFVNKRTGEVTYVPVGIDPGWHTNPGLSRARTLVENVAMRLEQAGEEAAKIRIQEILASPAPRILMGVDERLSLPVAVSGRMQEMLGARSPIIWATNDVIRIKTSKPAVPVELADFLALQEHLDRGELVDEGKPDQRAAIFESAGRLLKAIVKISGKRILRIATLFPTSRRKIKPKG
jgi:hypothetical protein